MKTNGKDTKLGVVPALRFPEFRNYNEWVEVPIHQIGTLLTGLSGKNSSNFRYGKPFITYKQVYSDTVNDFNKCDKVFINNSEKQNSIQQGDILFTTSSETPDEVGVSSVVLNPLPETIYLNSFCFILRPHDINQLYPLFAKYLFQSPIYRKKINKLAQGAIRFNLSKNQFIRLSLPIPKETKEQQKTADCLSSLDALIKATENKIDELKAHKKGLMQQLFPAEGKTTPALRFPEFQNIGEWNVIELGKLTSRVIKKNRLGYISKVLTNSAADGVVDQAEYFDRNIVSENNLHNYYVIENGDYVYNPRVSASAPVGPISKNYIGQGVMSPLYIIFRFHNIENEFYNQYFKTKYWHKYLKNVANQGARFDRMNIATNDFMNMPLPVPAQAEQQKIADCLSSIDDLIMAQTNRLEALKAHKKGLMQQLFPNIDEC